MARVLTTVEAVRARFTALERDLAFFDGPGGTQVTDSVIDAIADYLRHANANVGGPFETSRLSDALVTRAHAVAAVGADVLLCSPYKFYGPHLGLAFGRRELLESWRPY